ncbi:enoyl-CoA hydratase/isomerase family protein [Actinomadura madurae]|uniref:enoyl-CoA hydratase/isomerase family protein n=1 Tax=Actinomadura madurae TaxID=1993 RepID=UPI0020261375|nr:enoyl-CoA hydratase/isomerase family protein [Actinomadura madurae]URM93826.1 enoyl-CoA hydratase/isomerase family protein [Actinomadura madurae]URN04549.1 enoyl-CoA hydratase/isomerase family protein [Actinomadura madurae]
MSNWTCGRGGRVAWLSFDRPPDDQVRFDDLVDLRGELTALAPDEDISVVVLGSARPGGFIGHADRGEIKAMREGGSGRLEEWLTTLLAIEDLPQPVVAAVRGPARGGGCEIALACTFRIAGPQASFCQLEIDRGAMPGAGATQRLPRLIGAGRAAHMIMTGRAVGAAEAQAMGLVDAVIEGPDVAAGMARWAGELASKPRASLVGVKRALLAAQRLPMAEGLRLEQRLFHEVLTAKGERA